MPGDNQNTTRQQTGMLLLGLAFALSACSPAANQGEPDTTPRFSAPALQIDSGTIIGEPNKNALRNAYFGDLHVHTAYSFDAFAFGTTARPSDKGLF